jgi:hypothetical protein
MGMLWKRCAEQRPALHDKASKRQHAAQQTCMTEHTQYATNSTLATIVYSILYVDRGC